MFSNTVQKHNDPGVSLSLQSLIDERSSVTPYTTDTDLQGLSSLIGQKRSRRRGHGLEFEDLRTYNAGDDIRHIDWKVSARHNQLYTRIFREEKEQLFTLVLDFTSPMFTGSVELKAIQAGRMAANMAWQLVSAGARCGLLIQTDKKFYGVRPALGDRAALAICTEIAKQFEQAKHDTMALSSTTANHARTNITLLDRLLMSDRSTGAVILLAGLNYFDQTADHIFLQKLKELQVARQSVVISIEDPIEYTPLPTGFFCYKSTNANASIVLNKKQTEALKSTLERQDLQVRSTFEQAQIPLLRSRVGIVDIKAALNALGFLA